MTKLISIQKKLRGLSETLLESQSAIENVCELLDQTNTKTLPAILRGVKRKFAQSQSEIEHFSGVIDADNPDEIEALAQIYNRVTRSTTRLGELLKNVQNVFATSSLDDASVFGLMKTHIDELIRYMRRMENTYQDLLAYYMDDTGQVIQRMELEEAKKKRLSPKEQRMNKYYLESHE